MENINGTDVLLLQRLDTQSATPEMYGLTLNFLASYITLNSNETIEELGNQVDENTVALVALKDSMAVFVGALTVVQLDVARHEDSIIGIEERLNKSEIQLDGINTRAKVHLYYNWIESLPEGNPNLLEPGQMWVSFAPVSNEISSIYYSTIDSDGIIINQPYIFANETLELTSAYDPLPENPSKLRYRSIHLINEAPIIGSTYIELRVTTTQRYSDGEYPYYDEYSQQPAKTRSDIYPQGADLDELKTDVSNNYLDLSGTNPMTGDLIIEKGVPKIELKCDKTSVINSNGRLRFMRSNTERFELNGTNVKFFTDIDVSQSKVINLQNPSNATDAANKQYVDQRIDNIDLEDLGIDDQFTPGQQVAKIDSSIGVEAGGFYIQNSTLYVKI